MLDPQALKRVRSEFPILSTRLDGQPLCYLDNAATTQKPRAVIDAITQFYRKDNSNVHRAAHTLASRATEQFENARDSVAKFLNASSDEIIWTRGATESINLVAYSYLLPLLGQGDRVLLAMNAHHANIVPWQMITQQSGAQIDVISLNEEGDLDLEHFNELLKNKPKLVALPHVSNALGTVNPVKEMTTLAHQAGATVLIDGAQAVGHFKVDIHELDCDFYALSGHKLFGPTGIGVLWARAELLENMPPWQSGGEMIESVSFEETRFSEAPLRFEAGTPDIAGAIGLSAAIEFFEKQDRAALETHEKTLANKLREELNTISDIQLLPAGKEQISIVTFTHNTMHASDIASALDQAGIAVRAGTHCAQPLLNELGVDSAVRVSIAFYNTEEEVLRVVEVLRNLMLPEIGIDENSLGEKIDAVESATTWPERLNALMSLGSIRIPGNEKVRTSENELFGCASRTWIRITERDKGIELTGDSESRQICALLHLIRQQLALGNKLPAISDYLTELGLERQLSRTRGNAVQKLLNELQMLD